MQDVQASGKVVERGVVVDHRLALPIDQAHTGFGLDAANARDGNGYAVFGRVVEGMDVVDKIKAVPTATKAGQQNVPIQPVLIKKATLEN